ncbi:MAG: hypothetical protein P4L77_12095 [Sulfuriferula sp.]|nr:hypothetical protein [Sulfuriferula sp.]
MAFSMNFQKEQLTGAPPVPVGVYTLQLKGFKQKPAKIKEGQTESESMNLNPDVVIIGNAEYEGRKVFPGLNTKAPWIIVDFVHACGLTMEEVQNENAGTEKADFTIPGVFVGSEDPSVKPEDWKYQGPLLNATMEVELAFTPATGGYKEKNEVRQYICKVPGCTEKHSTNLIRG